ncbi:uracil-xanthine permease family protein [Bifidobacterium angulatum]|jgi:NCS2 family nucleobase:cation symporter-2|uniref:Permease n=1 Tax=Bifidobacterium angulatum DSM 20098 = JCM 7096 TaxID=518635 RepID=C4FFQ0_9BIFI|nr:solute carrier family 23 protein [Bifidobacterium angulatum]EEP20892.1 putative permease [Bifidobacterium angulatum DSM 20098 = JCM 7096]KFI41091.1 Xanthine/uracil permease [Bifidobacterium angulatum]BAQ96658.1 putative transport protein [Bifidobacterium angulatum DSM 20098 = JCM 7096]
MSKEEAPQLVAGIDDKIPVGKSIVLGLQHILSMDLYIMPLILGGAIGLQGGNLSFFLQMSFFACGIATLLQSGMFMKYPIAQGPSYVPLGALCMIGATMGIPTMIGSLIPGALIVILLGVTKLFSKFIRKAIPPFIGGIIILIVGLTLVPTAVTGVFSTTGNLTVNAISGSVTFVVLLLCMVLQYCLKNSGLLHMCSVIIALVVGTLVAVTMGGADFSSVSNAAWFALPQPFHFDLPQFNLSACLLMVVVYLFVMLDTTGTWFTVKAITGADLNDRRIDRGTIGEGLGCLVGACFGGTPMTGYSSNAGLIAITKVASRRAMIAGGTILVVLGFCPKLMAIITSLPTPVINGVFAMVAMTLIANGIKMVKDTVLDDRATLILGVAVMCGASTMILPDDVVSAAPQFVQFFLSSGIAVGGTAAILLQLLLPKTVSLTGTAPKAASASTAASASSVSNKERVQQVVNA